MAAQLNLYGDFPSPWKTHAAILDALNKVDEWFPGTEELRAFARSGAGFVEGMVNVANVMCSIAKHRPVSRVNIFTHGVDGYLSGRVIRGNVIFSSKPGTQLLLDDETIKEAEAGRIDYNFQKMTTTINSVRDALGNASMFIYACHSGLDQTYLQKIAKMFRIPVWGLKNEILFHPVRHKYERIIDGWEYSVRGSEIKVKNFHNLGPYFECVLPEGYNVFDFPAHR
jgi:hypothetical protein